MFRSKSEKNRTSIFEDGDMIATIRHDTGMVDLEISGCDYELLIFMGETAQRLIDDGYID